MNQKELRAYIAKKKAARFIKTAPLTRKFKKRTHTLKKRKIQRQNTRTSNEDRAHVYEQKLRNRPTYAEKILYAALEQQGMDFGFQIAVPIHRDWSAGFYIPDFTFKCIRSYLYVEVDGSSHDGRERQDASRDWTLGGWKNKVIHFTYDEVITDVKSVIYRICDQIVETGKR
jgi:very-short-patch-repair endonuclease